MKLDQGLHAKADRCLIQVTQLGVVETLGDQQNAIGPDGSGFQNLVLIEGEKFVLLLLRGQAPRLAGAGTVSKLVSHASLEISFFLVGLDLDFLDELSKLPNGFSFSSNKCCKFTMHHATGAAVCKM